MRIFVTHIKPHLDDICAIWLYQKFVPGWQRAMVRYIATSATGAKALGGKPVDMNPNFVHVGVCRGKYDEHKGNVGESATTLVFKDLKKRKLLSKDKLDVAALERLVAYALEVDLGQRKNRPDFHYEFPAVIMGIPDSQVRTATAMTLLDAFFLTLRDDVLLDHDWKKRTEFNTPWGRGVAITSRAWPTNRAYADGFVLAVHIDPVIGFRSIRAAAASSVDLTRAYGTVREMEPKADWYLHHSKRMLICGSSVAPDSKHSKLTLAELIALVDKV